MNASIKVAALAWTGLAAAQASASSYGCGRLLQTNGDLAAVLVLNEQTAEPSDGSNPTAGQSQLSLVVCGKKGCGREMRLGSVRPVALTWHGRHLTLFGDPPPTIEGSVPTTDFDIRTLPMSASTASTEPLLRFDARKCYPRPSAGG